MTMGMSAAVKVACFELQQVRPQKEMNDMREIAMVLELMLQSVCGSVPYNTDSNKQTPGPRRKYLEQAASVKVAKASELEKKK